MTTVSILIPARNESENILPCLHSILAQTYPKTLFEIIVIDDHSSDNTATLVHRLQHPQIRLLRLADFLKNEETQSFKKKAIEIGITQSAGKLIVTTDADCLVQPNWLALLVSFYEQRQLKFIAAPVNFFQEKNLFERFQSLDFMGMMCVTGAGIQAKLGHLCNGANLAYEKAVFQEVGGFEGINHLATGDDMLLLHKIASRYPKSIGFLKNVAATTYTQAQPTLESFISQRIRWASKSTNYTQWRITFTLAMVFFFCCNILLSLLLIPLWTWWAMFFFCGQLFIKMWMDYFFLGTMAQFFNRSDLMKSYFPAQFLHILYIVSVGILGNIVRKYEWKGRRVK